MDITKKKVILLTWTIPLFLLVRVTNFRLEFGT